jgi:hypothetical protein
MVQNPGKTLRPGLSLRRINLPEPLEVAESDSGGPLEVRSPGRQAVSAIEDMWRIDDEWWRSEPISRLYYAVLLNSGQRLAVYKDLIAGKWYRQGY